MFLRYGFARSRSQDNNSFGAKTEKPTEGVMDEAKARRLVKAERNRVEALLGATTIAGEEDRGSADEPGDMTDPANPLTDEELADAVTVQLRDRLAALARAERRLDEGTYGLSVLSGQPIPDARLEADPAAEITVEEAAVADGRPDPLDL
jgi:DnaK suppressor protein